jgi:cation transport protein ChaC
VETLSDEFWVFGYGSLMWRPGSPSPSAVTPASRLSPGAVRPQPCPSGTPEKPGLVLGLDRGGQCHGVAFRVASRGSGSDHRLLREREQVTSVYLERRVPARLEDGRMVEALTYTVDRNHPQYAGRLPPDDLLGSCARGRRLGSQSRIMCARRMPT